MTFVADRAVMSSTNLGDLEDLGYDYILSADRRRDDLAEELLVKDVPGSGEVRTREVHSEEGRRYVLCLNEGRRESDLEKLKSIKETCKERLDELAKRFEGSQEGRGRPMTEEGAMSRARKILGKNRRLFNVQLNGKLMWDLKDEERKYERAIAGKFLLVTTEDLKPSETLDEYKNLKEVEKAFDELKNFLRLRPFNYRTDKGVRGHTFICILALLTKRLMERKTGSTFREIMDELEPLKANILNVKGEKIYQRNETTSRQEEIFESLDAEVPPRLLVETKK